MMLLHSSQQSSESALIPDKGIILNITNLEITQARMNIIDEQERTEDEYEGINVKWQCEGEWKYLYCIK